MPCSKILRQEKSSRGKKISILFQNYQLPTSVEVRIQAVIWGKVARKIQDIQLNWNLDK